MMAPPPPLLVRAGDSRQPDADRTLTTGKTYWIGRDPASDIPVDDQRVSWKHATLEVDDGAWVLRDAGSTNGTYHEDREVDGIAIAKPRAIRLGDGKSGPLLLLRPAPPEAMPSAEMMPSVDRRPSRIQRLPARITRIGRSDDNDVVVSDLGVSRHHAELRGSSENFEIIDLGSHNGTFVNGERVTRASVGEDDIIAIGNATFRLAGGELRTYIDTGEVSLQARELTVRAGRKTLLDEVSFPIPERCLLAVIGPSGAGKSTLLGAMTGTRPADSGSVLYDNRDLYREYAELRQRIGLVPQQSVMHTQLTPADALKYAAELRFPSDTQPAERAERVREVMAELGLSQHAETRADRLSGGQLKRVNVAMELLAKPSLLFLDEPTSGLDPGLDLSVMEQMRDLAHDGRTVIVVTHSVDNLDTCDQLLVLVPGGRVAYYGPPEEGLRYFGMRRWAEVFQAFEAHPERDWAAEFERSPEYRRYVAGPLANAPDHAPRPAAPQRRLRNIVSFWPRSTLRQTSTLARRYLRVISADRGFLAFTVLLPLVLGGLIRCVPSPPGLEGAPGTNAYAEQVLLVLLIGACLAGAASSVRELVKERGIYLRERAAGLSCAAYMSSKILVLGVISVLQAAVMTVIGLAGRALPASGVVLGSPLAELIIGTAALAFASMALGLLVSAAASTSEKTMPFLVVLTMVQVVLSGSIFSLVGKAGVSQLAWLSPSRWGLGALASTVNLNVITPGMAKAPDTVWNHNQPTWLLDIALTLLLAVILSAAATWRMHLLSPGRRK